MHRDSRLEKELILQQIQELDAVANDVCLNDDGWLLTYHLEETLVNLYQKEEDFSGGRGAILSGHCRVMQTMPIFMRLQIGEQGNVPSRCLQDRLWTSLRFKHTFMSSDRMGLEDPQIPTLVNNLWSEQQRVLGDENEAISLSFSS
jgi:hypothetical protein